MPSITTWNRLEPSPRDASIVRAQRGEIRDPLWMLTRQWQLGEFIGADAGSPAYVEFAPRVGQLGAYRAEFTKNAVDVALPPHQPLEKTLLEEPLDPEDLTLAVELGQLCESLLRGAHVDEARIDLLRKQYPLGAARDDDSSDVLRFLAVCAGHALDGVALVREIVQHAPALPPLVVAALGAGDGSIAAALSEFRSRVAADYGPVDGAAPATWRSDRLEYGASVTTSGDLVARLRVTPASDGELDWFAYDVMPGRVGALRLSAPEPIFTTPTHVRFRGMPNARWWDFESGVTDFGAMGADVSDLARLVLMEFMLVQGNDWFVFPYRMPVGTLCEIDSLIVHDVFGGQTIVERTDADARVGTGRPWTMFTMEDTNRLGELSPFMLLPPTAATAREASAPIEEVRFFRDEVADLAWAVEHATPDRVGNPWLGAERSVAVASSTSSAGTELVPASGGTGSTGDGAAAGSSTAEAPPLTYRLQTAVPPHWVPFIPVSENRANGTLLRQGCMRRVEDGSRDCASTTSAILSGEGGTRDLWEAEVPREGVTVTRVHCRTRWVDGTTHSWIERRVGVGQGEGSSGLESDLAVQDKR